MDLNAVIDAIQSSDFSGKESTKTPIGVPDDYLAVGPQTSRTTFERGGPSLGSVTSIVATPPRYFSGDEFGPAGVSGEDVAVLQQNLADLGFLKTYRMGVWDDASSDAYRRVLEYANRRGVDDRTAMMELARAPEVDTEAAAKEADQRAAIMARTNLINISNPTDLGSAFTAGFEAALGRRRKPSADELAQMIADYHQKEIGRQRQQFHLQQQQDLGEGTGGEVQMPDVAGPEAFAEEYARKAHEGEAKGHDLWTAFTHTLDVIGRPGGIGGATAGAA